MTTAAIDARAGRRCHNALNSLHSTHYFSPDLGRELGELGVTDPRAVNFAVRAAALGPVGAGSVTATFYNYKHDLVAGVWEPYTPEQFGAPRPRAVDATLRRLLGEETLTSAQMSEAAGLALRAAEGCSRSARPLYSAHADLPVPDAPHLAFWHAATLLREHRGDGHLAALVTAGLDGLEALVTHTATGRGMAPKWIFPGGVGHRDGPAARPRPDRRRR
jgi:hypothetical protein